MKSKNRNKMVLMPLVLFALLFHVAVSAQDEADGVIHGKEEAKHLWPVDGRYGKYFLGIEKNSVKSKLKKVMNLML